MAFSIATICGYGQSNTEKKTSDKKLPNRIYTHPIDRDKTINVIYEEMPDSIFVIPDPINNVFIYNKKALDGIIFYGANFRYHKAATELVKLLENKEDFLSHTKKGEYPIITSKNRNNAEANFIKNPLENLLMIKDWQQATKKGCLDPNHIYRN